MIQGWPHKIKELRTPERWKLLCLLINTCEFLPVKMHPPLKLHKLLEGNGKLPACVLSHHSSVQFSSVQSLSRVRLFPGPWITVSQASLFITNSWSSVTHVDRVGDAIQPSHLLSSPSPPAPNHSQHQGLFQLLFSWSAQSTRVSASASVLPKNTQNWSPIEWTG